MIKSIESKIATDKRYIDDVFERLDSEDPFATSIEDTWRMGDIAHSYLIKYEGLLEENKKLKQEMNGDI